MYLLAGEMKFYIDGRVIRVKAGECMFLPREEPHAFVIASEEVHLIVFITPGGFDDAINKLSAPAERMEIPNDADTETYANADLTETIKLFEQHGIRFLTAEEVRTQMPEYPH